jgi:hypothetical protein
LTHFQKRASRRRRGKTVDEFNTFLSDFAVFKNLVLCYNAGEKEQMFFAK